MHIQIVNFNLNGVSEEEFSQLCAGLAPAVAALPGLHSKVFLADPATNTYGGVYTWQNRQAMADFMKTDLFNTIATHPNLDNISSKDFGVLAEPTQVTHGWLAEAVV